MHATQLPQLKHDKFTGCNCRKLCNLTITADSQVNIHQHLSAFCLLSESDTSVVWVEQFKNAKVFVEIKKVVGSPVHIFGYVHTFLEQYMPIFGVNLFIPYNSFLVGVAVLVVMKPR